MQNECFFNVFDQVNLAGGKAVFGWQIWYFPGLFIEAEQHCIWERPDGAWLDVTPKIDGENTILFVEDDNAKLTYDEPKWQPNRRKPDTENPLVSRWLEAKTELEVFSISQSRLVDRKRFIDISFPPLVNRYKELEEKEARLNFLVAETFRSA